MAKLNDFNFNFNFKNNGLIGLILGSSKNRLTLTGELPVFRDAYHKQLPRPISPQGYDT